MSTPSPSKPAVPISATGRSKTTNARCGATTEPSSFCHAWVVASSSSGARPSTVFGSTSAKKRIWPSVVSTASSATKPQYGT